MMKRTGKRTYSAACFLSLTDDIFENEDIIQEMAEHSEYNRECEEVLACIRKSE